MASKACVCFERLIARGSLSAVLCGIVTSNLECELVIRDDVEAKKSLAMGMDYFGHVTV